MKLPPLAARRWIWLALLTLFLASPWIVNAWLSDGTTVCGMKAWAGVGCPSCGLTRATISLSKGQVFDSMGYHLFAVLIYTIGIGLWIYYLIAIIRDRELFLIQFKHVVRVWIVLLIGMVTYWLIRLGIGAIP